MLAAPPRIVPSVPPTFKLILASDTSNPINPNRLLHVPTIPPAIVKLKAGKEACAATINTTGSDPSNSSLKVEEKVSEDTAERLTVRRRSSHRHLSLMSNAFRDKLKEAVLGAVLRLNDT